jgi:hypothetical protein
MYSKIRNTLSGLSIALAMLAVSYGVGEPPQAPVGEGGHRLVAGSVLELPSSRGTDSRKRSQGVRRHISMPYFSFGPLLPRRES